MEIKLWRPEIASKAATIARVKPAVSAQHDFFVRCSPEAGAQIPCTRVSELWNFHVPTNYRQMFEPPFIERRQKERVFQENRSRGRSRTPAAYA